MIVMVVMEANDAAGVIVVMVTVAVSKYVGIEAI